jgi:outer membrane protein assembly factor BamB
MIGQSIRCPNLVCRQIFLVGNNSPPAGGGATLEPLKPSPGAAEKKTVLGDVGDLIPLLPAEQVAPAVEKPIEKPAESNHVGELVPLVDASAAEVVEPVEVPSWQQPPPVRRPVNPAPEPEPATAPHRESKLKIRTDSRRQKAKTTTPIPPPEPAEPEGKQWYEEPAPAEPPSGPRELGPGEWDAPPVRSGPDVPAPAVHDDDVHLVPVESPEEPEETQQPGRGAGRLIKVFALLVLVVLGAGGYLVYRVLVQTEEKLSEEALKDYKENRFNDAETKYGQLVEKFPSSERLDEYREMKKLAELRKGLADVQMDIVNVLDLLPPFLDEHKKSEVIKAHARGIGTSLHTRVITFTNSVGQPDSPKPREVVEKAEKVVTQLGKAFPDALTQGEKEQLQREFNNVRIAVAKWEDHEKVLKDLREIAALPPPRNFEVARKLINSKEEAHPGLGKEPAVEELMRQMVMDHIANVKYIKEEPGPQAAAPLKDDGLQSLVVDPLLQGRPAQLNKPGIVLALVRGVLYALDRSTGRVTWAMRVGIDTDTLPVRVPATATMPERILVLSADTHLLTALDDEGKRVWQYQLSQACLGRPVIIDQRAFLPTKDGNVYEIELVTGRLLGRFQLGQSLTTGGTRQEKTNLVYFPADDSCVYILDVAEKKCQAILYSNHRSYTLRGEPLIVAPENPAAPRFLILNQTDGLDAMQLRVFTLPTADFKPPREGEPFALVIDAAKGLLRVPEPLDPAPRVNGSTWFQPYYDDEKLAMLSDRGMLGLFRIRQVRNNDPALFPLYPAGAGGFDLEPLLLRGRAGPLHPAPGKAEVVQVDGTDFWVLVHGRLDRLQLVWKATGPHMVHAPLWKEPLVLGSPLHASQVEDLAGRPTLFLVTQPLDRAVCLATAVDQETGNVVWQRQLGVICQGEPLVVSPPVNYPATITASAMGLAGGLSNIWQVGWVAETMIKANMPLHLVMDQGGGLVAFDPLKLFVKELGPWQSGGQRVADPVEENLRVQPLLMPGTDEHSAFQIAFPGKGTQLVLRHIVWDPLLRRLIVKGEDTTIPLSAGLAGTPARLGNMLLLPLDNGVLVRVDLTKPNAQPLDGPNWRARLLGSDARGHVVALGGNLFLTTDGGFGVRCWSWPAGVAVCSPVPPLQTKPNLLLKDRPATAPLLVPSSSPQVCFADVTGAIHLLEVEAATGKMALKQTWKPGGRCTGGPFLRKLADGSVRVGCILDQVRLVWLDPENADVLWQYGKAGEVLVGQPQVVEDVVVVANQAGRIVALDPRTGEVHKTGFTLKGSIAPAASPAAFFQGRLFTPLSDGTVLLLGMEQLGK